MQAIVISTDAANRDRIEIFDDHSPRRSRHFGRRPRVCCSPWTPADGKRWCRGKRSWHPVAMWHIPIRRSCVFLRTACILSSFATSGRLQVKDITSGFCALLTCIDGSRHQRSDDRGCGVRYQGTVGDPGLRRRRHVQVRPSAWSVGSEGNGTRQPPRSMAGTSLVLIARPGARREPTLNPGGPWAGQPLLD
jgi:hypothetical protein